MRILGISAFYHDSAAALLEDGEILAAVQEERFSRIKHDSAFPRSAVAWCLKTYPGKLDAVVYYEKPLLKFERILSTALAVAPRGFRSFAAAMPDWLNRKLWLPSVIEDELLALGQRDVPLHFTSHHEAHAASAFFPSPFERAAILTLDGVGEWSTTAFGHGKGAQMELTRELRFPHSLGLLYSAFTYHCGFRVNSGEYKLMGLAPYGEPRFAAKIREHLIDLRDDGSFRLNLEFFGYLHGETMTSPRFATLFEAPARKPESPLTQLHCDLARSVQEVTEEIVLRLAKTLHQETQEENLCLAGGVALNCVANARLLRDGPFKRIWVQPAAGDAGGALGAALAVHHLRYSAPRVADNQRDKMKGAFLGPSYQDEEIADLLAKQGLPAEKLAAPLLHERLAACLAAGKVVGYFHGRAEFGPRALGGRSILADARSAQMQSVLNLKIKFRESFRPFAPIVLAERAGEYFELAGPSPYMLFTAPVRSERRLAQASRGHHGGEVGSDLGARRLAELHTPRSDIPAVTHLDYSARVQTVDRAENPDLHALLFAFDRLTGCPVLINTSFNVRGEPPVCGPREAIACFLNTDIDVLALGPYLIDKRSLPKLFPHQPRPPAFGWD